MGPSVEIKNWNRCTAAFLREHQSVYVASPYRNLQDLISNGRRIILVTAAHQDDDAFGMGGTMRLYSEGVVYRNEVQDNHDQRTFTMGGLPLYSKSEVRSLQKRLAEKSWNLNLLPEEPSNVITLYVTNGAKSEEAIYEDLKAAHPGETMDQLLGRYNMGSLAQMTHLLNSRRYPETLSALSYVRASAAIFLDYPSKAIKPNGNSRNQAVEDLSAVIENLKSEVIYTLSPFEFTHDTHIFVSALTVKAVRQQLSERYHPQLKGYPVWDPIKLFHREIVDISQAIQYKLDAIHQYGILGSQGVYGRNYESMIRLNQALAVEIALSANSFTAVMHRPRFPSGVHAVEIFIGMNPLLMDRNMTLQAFVAQHFQKILESYPNTYSVPISMSTPGG